MAMPQYNQAMTSIGPTADSVSTIIMRVRGMLIDVAKVSDAIENNIDKISGPSAPNSAGIEKSPPDPSHLIFNARQVELALGEHLKRLTIFAERLANEL